MVSESPTMSKLTMMLDQLHSTIAEKSHPWGLCSSAALPQFAPQVM
jgi:hypothetical protein